MKPFFSVVIPSYNRAYCLSDTIGSVLRQSFSNWELILVDDGSTDDTGELVKSFSDPRIRYFYKTNGERGAARNFGAKKAEGDYIFFLDSDDLIKPTYLEVAHRHIEKSHATCLHIPYNHLINGTEKEGSSLKGDPQKFVRIQNRLGCQVIVHRSVLAEFQFSENRDFKIGEDWYFVLLVMSKYHFEILPERLGLMVHHAQRSMVKAPYEVVLKSALIFEEELLKHFPSDQDLLNNVRHEMTSLAALHAAVHGHKRVAWKLMMKSIRVKFSRVFRWRNVVILKKILFG